MSKRLADVAEDLADLMREAVILREQINLYEMDVKAADAMRELLSKSGLAANTTKLYTGCEQIMEHLAKTIDKASIGHASPRWHAQLLKRMSQPWPDVREAIISGDLFDRLNRLRSFRHRERTSYGRELDGAIVTDRAREMADAADSFRREVEAFMRNRAGPTDAEKQSN